MYAISPLARPSASGAAVTVTTRPDTDAVSPVGTEPRVTVSASPSGSETGSVTCTELPAGTVTATSDAVGGRFTRSVIFAGADTSPSESTTVYSNVTVPLPVPGSMTSWFPLRSIGRVTSFGNVTEDGTAANDSASPSGSTSLASGVSTTGPVTGP